MIKGGIEGTIPRPQRGRSPIRSIRGVINTISGGFAAGGVSSPYRKRHVKSSRTTYSIYKRSMPTITFTDEDFQDIDLNQDDPMVITIEIEDFVVMKTLVNQGSFINI